MTLRLRFWAFGALAALVLVGDYSGAIAKEKSVCEALKAIDPDNDGTVDLNEAKKAASALFDKLDKDGTLTTKELHGRLSRTSLRPRTRTKTPRSARTSISPSLSLASRPPTLMGKARSIAMRPRVMPAGL